MAADDIAKGALQLIKWGKKIIPATAEEVAQFGPNAPRVKALLNTIEGISDDAAKISSASMYSDLNNKAIFPAVEAAGNVMRRAGRLKEWDTGRLETLLAATTAGKYPAIYPAEYAAYAEVMSDLIKPQVYRTLTNPMAVARRFDMTVPNAPEGFTNAARTLGERRLVSGPKDIEMARRISMLPPHLQDVYFSLLQDGSDPMAMLAAMKLLG